MNKDQGYGMIERTLYSALMWLGMKFVAWGWFDPGLAADFAAFGVFIISNGYAWWHNRPASVLSRAGNAVPENSKLVITTTAGASRDEKQEAHALADVSGDKVTAKTTG